MSRRIKNGLLLFVASGILFSTLVVPQHAYAECLGLGVPPPRETNICETLLEDLVVRQVDLFCDLPEVLGIPIGPPQCYVPGACHVDPTCFAFEAATEIVSIVAYAGDLYCDTREVHATDVIDNLIKEVYPDSAPLTRGGVDSILYGFANAHIDLISCQADPIPSALQDVIAGLVDASALSEDEYFYPIDIDRAEIVSRSNDLAKIYLPGSRKAITLDSLVILDDSLYRVLVDWKYSWEDVLAGVLTPVEEDALFTLIHELVHVRQYRQLGKQSFINAYLPEAIVNGYPDIGLEDEAYRFEGWAECYYNSLVAQFAGKPVAACAGSTPTVDPGPGTVAKGI